MIKDESLKAITRTANDVEAIAQKATLAAIAAGKEQAARLEHDVADARKDSGEANDLRRVAERERDAANTENQGNKATHERILQERNNFSSEAKTTSAQLKTANEEISLITDRLKAAKKTANSATKALDGASESANKTIQNLQSDIAIRDGNIETYSVQIKELTKQVVALTDIRDSLKGVITGLEAELAHANKSESAGTPEDGKAAIQLKSETSDQGQGGEVAQGASG